MCQRPARMIEPAVVVFTVPRGSIVEERFFRELSSGVIDQQEDNT
jgi:hypothetical protein